MRYVGLAPTVFPFGKYKLLGIEGMVQANLRYCTWCLTLPAIAQRHPEFVTKLRRAVAEAQFRKAEAEEAARAGVTSASQKAPSEPNLADLL